MTSLIFLYWPSRMVNSSMRRSCSSATDKTLFLSKQLLDFTFTTFFNYSILILILLFRHWKPTEFPFPPSASGIPGLSEKNKVLNSYLGFIVAWCDVGKGHDSHANMSKQAKHTHTDTTTVHTPSPGTNKNKKTNVPRDVDVGDNTQDEHTNICTHTNLWFNILSNLEARLKWETHKIYRFTTFSHFSKMMSQRRHQDNKLN